MKLKLDVVLRYVDLPFLAIGIVFPMFLIGYLLKSLVIIPLQQVKRG